MVLVSKEKFVLLKLQLELFRGGRELLINTCWEKLFKNAVNNGLSPAYWRKFEAKGDVCLTLICIDEDKGEEV